MMIIEYQRFQRLFYDLFVAFFASAFLGFFLALCLWRLHNWILLKIERSVMKRHAERGIGKTGSL